MTPQRRNLAIWAVAAMVVLGLWAFAARTRLHFIDPARFLILVAVAAALLTGLLWWDMAQADPDREDPNPPPADSPGGAAGAGLAPTGDTPPSPPTNEPG